MGDGFCDDANNNIKCSWDEGDCCNNHHVGQFRYCTDCKCLDPKAHKESNCSGKCGSDSHKGDQFCDDDNNNCACDWDGGDCCGKNGNVYQYKYCFQCACMDPNFVAPKRINSISARNANVWNELLTLNFSARFLHHIM